MWKISASYTGASGSLTELGPPDIMIALKNVTYITDLDKQKISA